MDPDGTSSIISTAAAVSAPETNPIWYILLLLVLILCNAFFAASELAVISVNEATLRKSERGQTKKGQLVLKMLAMPTSFLATIQIGVTLSGFLASAVAADTFTEYIVYYGANWPIPTEVLRVVSLVVITALLSLVTLIFGELVPKRMAMQNPEKIAFAFAQPLWFFCKIFKPIAAFLSAATNFVVKLMGGKEEDEKQTVTEEELRIMVEESNENGCIEESQKDMINNIFEFDDKTVDEIMTHRTDIAAVSENAKLTEITALAAERGYSRIPVYRENLDNIIGILYVKDFLTFFNEQEHIRFEVGDFLHEAVYTPENTCCDDLFHLLSEKKKHMAIVVDEYGGTSGLVTMEDLLEEIVGNIQDEYDQEEPQIIERQDGSVELDGDTPIDEVEDFFEVTIEHEEHNTIGGLITGILGEIPENGQHTELELSGIQFTVTETTPKRILKITTQK